MTDATSIPRFESFDPSAFQGLKRDQPYLAVPVLGEFLGISEAVTKWDRHLTPIDDQGKTGTCVAQAYTRFIEFLLSINLNKWVQLDALKFFRLAWERENRRKWEGEENYKDGLRIDTGFFALQEAGLLSMQAVKSKVGLDSRSIWEALQIAPLIVGTCVTSAWAAGRQNPSTGELRWANVEMNGHCWLLHGMGVSNQVPPRPLVRGCNSWGPNWAWNGFFQIPFEHYVQCAICNPILIEDDPDFLKRDERWKDFVL